MTNLRDLLEKARAAGQKLGPGDAAVVFAAAVRLAAAQGGTLRARLLQIDEGGGLRLLPFDEREREIEPAYLAPELLAPDAPRKSEPRVQVYAAGALGYELLIGKAPPQRGPGPELNGPLGDIVRMALSADRRERFGDLTQLEDALVGVQTRPPGEGERNILAALRTRFGKPAPSSDLPRVVERVAALEQQLGKVQARADTLQQTIEHFEDGQRRLQDRKPPSAFVPGFFAGLLGAAAVLGAGWAMGLVSQEHRAPVAEQAKQASDQTAQTTPPEQPPAPVQPATPRTQSATRRVAPTAAEPAARKSSDDAQATRDPAAEAPAFAADHTDAGAPADEAADASVLAALPDSPPPDAGKPPPDVRKPTKTAANAKRLLISPAAMSHALAVSQVRRGEEALERGHADDALASFQGALDNEPGIAVAYRGMGMAYAVQGDVSQALQAYRKYLQLAPTAKDASDIRRSIAELNDRSKLGGEGK